jgi:hypothetical protein
MTRKLGSVLIALATVCIVLADASDAQARRRGGSHGSNGSWDSNGGSHGSNGSHGSWGGRGRRNGSHGSWGGRWRRNGGHGSNGSYGGNGSHGGYNNGCGSNGGSYGVSSHNGGAYYGEGTVHSAEAQSEVRYYGQRSGGTAVAPAPIYMENDQSSARPEIRENESQYDTGQGTDPGANPPTPPSQSEQGPAGTAPNNTPGVERGTGT